MISQKRYAVWLVPSEPHFSTLQQLIKEIAIEVGSVCFSPHATIVSGIRKVRENPITLLASRFKPIRICVNHVGMKDVMFRSLYLELDQNEKLMELRRQCLLAFSLDTRNWGPHVSLLYGIYSDAQKYGLLEKAKKCIPKSIVFDRLQLWRTDGPVQAWSPVYQTPLGEIRKSSVE